MSSPSFNNEGNDALLMKIELKREEPGDINKDDGINKTMEDQALVAEEEDYEPKGKEETSSDEDEVPLPQPGDMHVEFKKSSLPDRAKKPKIEFILFTSCRKTNRNYERRY